MMKIRYWFAILALCTSVFLAASPSSKTPKPTAVSSASRQNLDLAACRDDVGLKGDPGTMDERALRIYIKQCSHILLANEHFAALDSTITYLRDNKIRTPAGLWLQSLFYAGIEEYIGDLSTDVGVMQTEESLQNWIASSSGSDTAHMAVADLILHKAYLYRGTGYAADVSEENFKLFYEQISKAKKYLLEHEDIAARDPQWFTIMLSITRVEENGNEETHRGYFDKAVKLYPDYYPVFFTAAVKYLPKWGGSKESYDEFARYASGKAGAGQAKSTYARIYWADICSQCGDRDLPDWREHWTDLKSGFDEIIAQYPEQWNINSYAHIACLANDKDKTLEVMKKIEGSAIADAWNDEQFNYDYCASWSGLKEK